MKNPKLWGAILALLAIGFAIKIFLPSERIGPSVVAEPVFLIGSFVVSNAILVSWIVVVLLVLIAFGATRNMKLVPGNLQNLMEIAVEAVLKLIKG